MQFFGEILDNHVLLVSLFASFVTQGLKVLIELVRNGKFDGSMMFSTGSMPSSHSALVGALATGIGRNMGWSSPEFAIAAMFAVIVMYDATGVRLAAGKHARLLNQLVEELKLEHPQLKPEVPLKELLGHTIPEVLVGLVFGISFASVALSLLSVYGL